MAYTLTSSDSKKIIFDRAGTGCGTVIFIVAGSLFLLIGVAFNYFGSTWEFPYFLIRILLPLFGAGAIAIGFYIPRQARNASPARITFDHTLGAVAIDMTVPTTNTGYIRYTEIKEFAIYIEKRNSSSGKSGSRTYYYYHVLVRKHDGGEWFLTESGTSEEAEAIKAQLVNSVNLDQPFTGTAATILSGKLNQQHGVDKTIIQWQNKVAWWSPVILFVFAVLFLSILFSMLLSDFNDGGIFVYGIFGFMLLVFCGVMFTVIRTMVKDATTRYAVAVDNHVLQYYEFSTANGIAHNTRTVPLNELIGITYSFAPVKTYGTAGIFIKTKKDAEAELRSEKPLTALKNLFSDTNKPISLSITALNPVECLQLETWLQALLAEKGGVDVL